MWHNLQEIQFLIRRYEIKKWRTVIPSTGSFGVLNLTRLPWYIYSILIV